MLYLFCLSFNLIWTKTFYIIGKNFMQYKVAKIKMEI